MVRFFRKNAVPLFLLKIILTANIHGHRAKWNEEGKQDSVPEAGGSEDNAVSDVNTNADEEVPGDGMTGDDRMTDHADTEITKASTPALQSAGDSLTASAYPSSFDLRDRGVVTPVKLGS